MSVTLYHHTSWEGFKEIMDREKIRQSTFKIGGARRVSGVYLTSLGPEHVIYSDWDDAESAISGQRNGVDVIIQVSVQQEMLNTAHSNRDIYIHRADIPMNAITRTYKRDQMGNVRSFEIMDIS